MSHFEYQGFRGNVEFSPEDGCLIGRVAGINDVVSYEGDSVSEIKQSFHDAVDTYLDHCKETGTEPQKPLSGKIPLRVAPDLHWEIAARAEVEGKSLNAWIAELLVVRVKGLGTLYPAAGSQEAVLLSEFGIPSLAEPRPKKKSAKKKSASKKAAWNKTVKKKPAKPARSRSLSNG